MESSSRAQAETIDTQDSAQWNLSRKALKADQYKLEKQQK
jgi:hypothetical protein